jgi:hypothetical protein
MDGREIFPKKAVGHFQILFSTAESAEHDSLASAQNSGFSFVTLQMLRQWCLVTILELCPNVPKCVSGAGPVSVLRIT